MYLSYFEVKKESKSLKMDQIVYINYCGHSVVTMDNHQRWRINIFEHFWPECYHKVFTVGKPYFIGIFDT